MANNPTILVFGLPEQEETFLKKCLEQDGASVPTIGIYRSLGSLLTGPGALRKEFRDRISLVVLDRTYDVSVRKYQGNGLLHSFAGQLSCVRNNFPNAQVLCATNSPLRFVQEQFGEDFSDPCFIGTSSYASLHRNLHFGDALRK